MSYQKDRGECIAQLTKHGMPYHVIETLLRCATSINRYAELACSSEAADRDRIKCPAWAKSGSFVVDLDAKEHPKYPCLCDRDTGAYGPSGEIVEVHTKIPRIRLQDWRAEQRAIKAIEAVNVELRKNAGMFSGAAEWRVITSGDPRGYTLRVVPPAYAAENKQRAEHDPRTIGIPAGPSRLRW